MSDIEIQIGKSNVPAETEFYESVHECVKAMAGKLTPAQINGLMFQISLEVLAVWDDGEYYV